MATVGSSSAYAVRITLVVGSRWYWLTNTLLLVADRYSCCAKKILRPKLVVRLPMASRDVDSTHRLLYGWRYKALPRVPTFYESVHKCLQNILL